MNAALLLTALFNGAWQGAVLCGFGLLAFRMFRRLNATTMFTVWSVLLAIAVSLPFLNYAFAPKPYVVRLAPTVRVAPPVIVPVKHVRILAVPQHAITQSWRDVTPKQYALSGPVSIKASAADALQTIFRYAPAILWVLAVISLLRLAVLMRDIVRMLAARRRVRPIDAPVELSGNISRPFRFAASDDFTSPCVLGFAPALIVIPEELLAERGTELTSVVLHEREHVRRFDDIQNVLQRFVGALAFFCPGVRIAIRELALYREQICDDAAVNATGDRLSYAMTLTDLAQWAQGRGAPVPSLIFKRKHLLHRLEVLLDSAVSHSLSMNRRFALAAVTALAIAAALVLRIQLPVIAQTIVTPKVAQTWHATRTIAKVAMSGVMAPRPQLVVPPPALVQALVPGHHKIVAPKALKKAGPVAPAMHGIVAPRALRRAPIPRHENATAVAIAPIAPRARYEIPYAVAYAYAYREADATKVSTTTLVANAFRQARHDNGSSDLLDALSAAGLRDLPVDQLIAIRDHGVTGDLVRSAVAYFGRVGPRELTYLADHGVGPSYIASLRQSGVSGISPADAVKLMDHGVGSALIREAFAYFSQRPSAEDLVYLADHGVGAPFIDSLRSNGVSACAQDAVNMVDHGVDAAYVAKIRRMNPHATIAEIIRLHDAGF